MSNELLYLLLLLRSVGPECDKTLREYPQLNAGEMLSVLLNRTAEAFQTSLSGEKCAAILWMTLRVAVERGALNDRSALEVPVESGVMDAMQQLTRVHLGDDWAVDHMDGSLIALLTQRMSARGPRLRSKIEQEHREVPVSNFIVGELLVNAIGASSLIRSAHPDGLIDVAANILWLCRALAFSEGMLSEPSVAQA